MGILFGKHSKEPNKKKQITEQDKAVLQLKMQRDKIKMYQKKMRNQLDKERDLARELLKNGQKSKALLLLKKKKFMENILSKTDGELENLDKLVMDIEFSQIQVEVTQGLQSGNEALKQIHSIMSIDKIETLMDETREGIEKQKEIDELIGGSFTEQDEESLMQELSEITREGVSEIKLPQVPQSELEEEEDEALVVREPTKKRQKQLVEAS